MEDSQKHNAKKKRRKGGGGGKQVAEGSVGHAAINIKFLKHAKPHYILFMDTDIWSKSIKLCTAVRRHIQETGYFGVAERKLGRVREGFQLCIRSVLFLPLMLVTVFKLLRCPI